MQTILSTCTLRTARRAWDLLAETAADCMGAVACAGGWKAREAGLKHNPDKMSRALIYPECELSRRLPEVLP